MGGSDSIYNRETSGRRGFLVARVGQSGISLGDIVPRVKAVSCIGFLETVLEQIVSSQISTAYWESSSAAGGWLSM